MADQRRIDMKMSGKPEEEAWILVINGKRANASGGYVKTKADLLKMKKYMGMVTQKVRDAYNKRLAELSKSKSADSIDAIAEKYGHEIKLNDANVDEAAFENVAGEIGPMVSRCSVLSNKIQELESGIKNLKTLKSQLKGYVGQIEAKVAKLNPATRKRLKTFLNATIRNVPKIKGL